MRAWGRHLTRFLGPWAGHLTILAFPGGGGGGGQFDRCQARGRAGEFEPGNEMAMSLQGDWNETSSSTRGSFERRLDDQISVIGKYLSSICVIVVHPLSILYIYICIQLYNDLYFIVLSLFRFPLWVICSFC